MLTTEEMRLKSKSLSLLVDSSSSSLMVLMVETCITRRPSTPHVKTWRSCYNFARGSCRFGNECKFVHDENAKSNGNKTVNGINSDELLTKLLRQLDLTTIWLQKILLGSEVLRRLVSYNFISCNKEKPPVLLCHACQLGKHVRLPFASSDTVGMYTAYLLLYVDDIVLTASSEMLLQQVIHSLYQEFSMIDHGSLNYFLGVFVTCDSTGMFLSQRKYAIEILERSHMVGCNPSWTSVDTESKLRDDSDLQNTSSSSGNDADADDAAIKPVYDEEPMVEVQLTTECNVFAIGQQHTEQPEFNNEGGVDQDSEQCYGKCPLPAKLTNHKTTELSNKSLNNEAKVKHDIDEIETINIELEHSVAKLLTENEHLNKENEHLKKTYKDLYDSIKKTRIQEKVLENATLKKELRKLKRNSVDTKFAKPSILGKLILQPLRNQSVVRQLSAFKSERPRISKHRFASQVDVKKNLSKPVSSLFV
ncbi:gag-pol polyprotein [Tanacetum coccineum]|uniref:Gag-pol polyprotein n=1 Tax=Tanacetum coccineum TaxID=301880 RepID=A0ABQ4X9U6_9ASTR